MEALITVIVVVVILAVLGIVGFTLYNKMVAVRNEVDNAWSNIDVQLKRRAELIPNLVNTVKGYATHEREVFTAVTQARSELQAANNPVDAANANAKISSLLPNIMAVAEAYPDLQASSNFLSLQEELSTTENKISFARQRYNDVTEKNNRLRETVPYNLFAGAANVTQREYFNEVTVAERSAPNVQF